MKKLLPIAAFLLFGSAIAQTSQNFETWSGNPPQPQGWTSANILVSLGNDTVCHKAVAPNVNSGQFSMKLETIKLQNNVGSSIGVPDTVCFAFTGSIIMFPSPTIKTGYPFISRPSYMDFYYKYTPVAGDSATAGIILTKWNTGTSSRDTVARGIKHMGATTGFTLDSLALTYSAAYVSGGNPDSAFIYFASSNVQSFWMNASGMNITYKTPQIGSMLWVDDWYTTAVGINELVKGVDYNAYPVPANEQYTITFKKAEKRTVSVFDVNGKLIENFTVADKTFSIKTSSYKNGIYVLRIADEKGNSAASDRIIVAH